MNYNFINILILNFNIITFKYIREKLKKKNKELHILKLYQKDLFIKGL